jgi:hypothetical protein
VLGQFADRMLCLCIVTSFGQFQFYYQVSVLAFFFTVHNMLTMSPPPDRNINSPTTPNRPFRG